MSQHLGFIKAFKQFVDDLKTDSDFIEFKKKATDFGVATVYSGHYPNYSNNVLFEENLITFQVVEDSRSY
jgi:hypothetical protein